jgi:hypothetical protein
MAYYRRESRTTPEPVLKYKAGQVLPGRLFVNSEDGCVGCALAPQAPSAYALNERGF